MNFEWFFVKKKILIFTPTLIFSRHTQLFISRAIFCNNENFFFWHLKSSEMRRKDEGGDVKVVFMITQWFSHSLSISIIIIINKHQHMQLFIFLFHAVSSDLNTLHLPSLSLSLSSSFIYAWAYKKLRFMVQDAK